MRILLSVLLLLFLLPTYSEFPRRDEVRAGADLTAHRVPLVARDPTIRKVGSLTYLGGVQLRSSDPAVGGYSSIHLVGDRFTLLSDYGEFVRFRMGADWIPRDIHFSRLSAGPGTGWRKRDRDSESLAVDPATGASWVGFEFSNAIYRYDRDLRHATGHAAPPAMADWPESFGPESMVRMRDGSFIVLSEEAFWPKTKGHAAIRFFGDPVAHPRWGYRFTYAPPKGYDPSDATQLPDGRLIVVNRTVSLRDGFTAKLTLVDPVQIARGKLVHGTVIATLAAPYIHDNFEGIAAVRQGADTILWIVSDDNQSFLQRTLLLKFRLDLPQRASAKNQAAD